jgi:hypothetical protein
MNGVYLSCDLNSVGDGPRVERGWPMSCMLWMGQEYVIDGPKVKMVMADNQSSTWANVINLGWPMIMCGSAYAP